MQVDLEHLHFWMQAIRQSPDPIRTMDAFWQGQIKSKEWLIDSIKPFITSAVSVDIHGGWVGVLASLLFQSDIAIKYLRSIDIDPSCQPIATMMNKIEEQDGYFKAITDDMCNVESTSDVIINTSCEHITQDQYDQWLANLPTSSLIVLQSNNYDIPEHIRWSKDLKEFESISNIDILWSGELPTQMYTRYMIIGHKNV